jgi:hypothetical protein
MHSLKKSPLFETRKVLEWSFMESCQLACPAYKPAQTPSKKISTPSWQRCIDNAYRFSMLPENLVKKYFTTKHYKQRFIVHVKNILQYLAIF